MSGYSTVGIYAFFSIRQKLALYLLMVGFSLKQNVPMLLESPASHCPLGYREQVPPCFHSFRRNVLILRAWALFHNVYLPSAFLPFKRLLQTLIFNSWPLFFVVNAFNGSYEHFP